MYNDNEFEFEGPEFGHEFEMEMENGYEASGNGASYEFDQEFMADNEAENEYSNEFEQEAEYEMEASLSENQEMELAHELLNVQNEEELDQFLGSLFKKVGQAVRGIARSPLLKKIGGVLKNVAKKALPIAGGAVGTFFGGPLGAAVGSKLGGLASNMFELEMEGLSPEDQEFETARAYVRFADSAARNAAALHRKQPQRAMTALARQALTKAAHQHAPGLLRPRNPDGTFRRATESPTTRSYGAQRQGSNGQSSYGSNGQGNYGRNGQSGYGSNGQGNYGSNGQSSNGQSYGSSRRPTQGTWTRRGRTLVIQL